MNTNMTGFRWFSKSLHPCAGDEGSLIIRRVKSHCINDMINLRFS